ncbi:Hypothetical predicted protein [Podarcis lilfordi]|uniref:Uncharacterized protein n=1 Tax=Podarcis lilfordi TaxID=74358 RepID=A0AA35P6Z8_9SAUR|nr:Hypothetical predicted protein [Podarcis lilfordi]
MALAAAQAQPQAARRHKGLAGTEGGREEEEKKKSRGVTALADGGCRGGRQGRPARRRPPARPDKMAGASAWRSAVFSSGDRLPSRRPPAWRPVRFASGGAPFSPGGSERLLLLLLRPLRLAGRRNGEV